jgi:DNA-binding NarL/FixJ family response regulator
MSSMRVLVVEGFVPFWQFIRSTLAERPKVQVICEVADGLEAVQKAEILEPDLVLLDIGLPTLNGIEAARQIRKVAAESKIIFVSQESSCEVVQEALNLGAWGYVVKTRAAIDLLAAVDAVLEGRQFVSSGLSFRTSTDASPPTASSDQAAVDGAIPSLSTRVSLSGTVNSAQRARRRAGSEYLT